MQTRSRLIEGEFAVTDIVREAASLSLATPLAEDGGRRILTGQFQGWMWMEQVQPGLLGSASDLRAVSDTVITQMIDRSIMMTLLLQGRNGRFQAESGEIVANEPGRLQLVGFWEARRCTRTLDAGEQAIRVGLTIRPAFLEQFADILPVPDLDRLGALLRPGFHAISLPRCDLLIQLATGLADMPYRGSLGMLFRESAVTQILFHTLRLLREDGDLRQRLGRRHHEAVLRARALLDLSLTAPPGTLELARQVGLNRNALQAGFKAMFGTTIFGYVRDQRLSMARLLIEEQGLGAAEAGYRVGFASPSAFSAAFRRHFGRPPTADGGDTRH